MKEKEILIKGALLHDIGKVCYRAMKKRINHSKLGGDFLEQYLKLNEETERLLNCVRYHHKDYLICNDEMVEPFENGTEVKASFEKIESCPDCDFIACQILHTHEGWITVKEIE